jgi:hypothetical protein
MIVCSPKNDAAEKVLGRSPSINTAKVKRKRTWKNKPICLHLCRKMHWKPFSLLWQWHYFFPYWPYISFIERRVPTDDHTSLNHTFVTSPEIFDFHCGATMILTNVTPKHSKLSIFWLFIYSLCCYEWFLFVHNLNTTNTKIDFDFPIYFN